MLRSLYRHLARIEADRDITLRTFLAGLIWLGVVPLMLLAVFLAFNHVQTLQGERDRVAADQVRNVATAVDRQLRAQIAALEVLAGSPLLDDPPRMEEFYNEARGFLDSFGSHVVLSDVSMHMLFNTRVPFGTELPMLPLPKGHAAAPAVIETGKPQVGDSFQGPIAKRPLVAAVVPVTRNGHLKYLLISVMETRQFQQRLDEVALLEGWEISVLDGKNDLLARRIARDGGDVGPSSESFDRFTAKSAVSKWSVVLQVPHRTFRSPIFAATATLALAILVVTFMSVLCARLAGRKLATAVAGLAQLDLPGRSGPVIREVETVRHLLEEAAAARKTAEADRRATALRFQQLFDNAPVPLCFVDNDGRMVNVNARFVQTFGYTPEDIPTGAEWWQRAYPDPDYRAWVMDRWRQAVREAQATGTDIEPVEYRVACKKGIVRQVEISGIVLEDGILAILTDITERRQAENALRSSLEEKVALLKEVHHRVKNNLQIVASLLNLQAARVRNPQALEVLQTTRDRVRSMALLHETLYRSGNMARIDFAAYVNTLCRQLIHSFGPVTARVKIVAHITHVDLPLEQSIPCGLIINELVSNALKHAFPDEREGTIGVELNATGDGRLCLLVRDDGTGLPAGTTPTEGPSLGLKLVSSLAEQLRGELEFESSSDGPGTAFIVCFPLPEDFGGNAGGEGGQEQAQEARSSARPGE